VDEFYAGGEAKQVLKNRWWVVVGSLLALTAGQGSINVYAAGIFLKPIAKEFAFGRGSVSTAIGLTNITTALATPFLGRLMDRYGVRPVLLPTIALFALTTASLSMLQASVGLLFVMFAIQGIVGAGSAPTPYAKTVSGRFDAQRGTALGIALVGTGLGTALVPPFAGFLLRNFGWRWGYVGLACAILVLGFIPVALCFGSGTPSTAPSVKKDAGAGLPGYTFSEAVATWRFWALAVAFFLGTCTITGSVIHTIPLLTDRGMSVAAAAAVVSVGGLSLIGGRLISGYIMDHLQARFAGVLFLLCPFFGIIVLSTGALPPVIGVILLTAGAGAYLNLVGYIVPCYFGLCAFGAIHGFIFGCAIMANAAGASILGWCFQLRHSYSPGFVLFLIFDIIAILLFLPLGAYKFPPRRKPAPAQPAMATAR
jgi:MFS family permease